MPKLPNKDEQNSLLSQLHTACTYLTPPPEQKGVNALRIEEGQSERAGVYRDRRAALEQHWAAGFSWLLARGPGTKSFLLRWLRRRPAHPSSSVQHCSGLCAVIWEEPTLFACIRNARTHVNTHTHTHSNSFSWTYAYAHIRTLDTYKHMHIETHTLTQTRTHTHIDTHTYTMQTYKHIHIDTLRQYRKNTKTLTGMSYIHPHTYIYTNVYTPTRSATHYIPNNHVLLRQWMSVYITPYPSR